MTGPENFMELRELRREIEAAEARAEEAERLLAELRNAVTGDQEPVLWRIAWLESMLREIGAGTFGRTSEDEDIDATMMMIGEIQDLAIDVRAFLERNHKP